MKIIIDAMGGDHAPDQIVRGALEAARDYGVEIILVGRGEDVLASMKRQGWDTLPAGVEVANADEVVPMDADPAEVVRKHKGSSMVLGLKMLADGQGDAFISAGNTGALLAAATLLVKRIRGIRRAALAPAIPCGRGSILVDSGANTECTPEFLLQFGCMGAVYSKCVQGKESPKVGLLNNGTEETKGDELRRQSYALLKEAGEKGTINFIGNIEARDVPDGVADVVVTDGFSGNVLLKTLEGTAIYMSKLIKEMFKKNLLTKLGALACKKGEHIRKAMDYREVGGAVLLGISKPVVKAHGSSDNVAMLGAIRQAMKAVESGFCDEIRANIDAMTLPKEV